MATLTSPTCATIWEDGGATLMARIVGGAGTTITQATITSIARKTFDLNGLTPGTAVETSAPVVASTVFDTYQTDARWTVDSTGYNFRDTIAAAIFATGNHRYRVEYAFTPTAGAVFWVVFELQCQPVWSS